MTFETELAKARKGWFAAAKEVMSICEKGRSALTNPHLINEFKGAFRVLEKYYSKFEDISSFIIQLCEDENKSSEFPNETEKKQLVSVKKYYYECFTMMETLSAQPSSSKDSSGNLVNASTIYSESKSNYLPKIDLPKFDGQILNWPKFKDTYVSLIHQNESLEAIQKFHYLSSVLSGTALSVISNLPIVKDNYVIAWEALIKTYDKKRILATNYLDQVLNYKPIHGKQTETLKHFVATVAESISAFRLLKIDNEAEFILFYLASKCLDFRTRERFEIDSKETDFPTVEQLVTYVRDHLLALQLAECRNSPLSTDSQNNFQNRVKTTSFLNLKRKPSNVYKSLVASNVPARKATSKSKSNISYPECLICNRGSHPILSCEKFHNFSVVQRLEYLKNWSGCFNCLSHLHSTRDCKSQWTCRFCKQKHHVMLHRSQLDAHDSTSVPPTSTLSAVLESSSDEITSVILGTAVVQIKDGRGQFQDVRLVLDCGSQHSFVTQRCVRRLGLDVSKFSKRISGIGETAFEGAKGQTSCTIRAKNKMSPDLSINAVVIKNITSFLPSNTFPRHLIKSFSRFELADPQFWVSSPVDFLLGAEVFDQLWTKPAIKLGSDAPSIFPSIFGDVVMGKYKSTPSHNSTSLFACSESDDLNDHLRKFWEIEEVVQVPILNLDEEACERHFQETHSRLSNGQYVVKLPFRFTPPSLDSKYMASNRFYSLEARLNRNQDLKTQYHSFMKEYIDLGHMNPSQSTSKYVIPHHSVMKEDRGKTKIRVVFDGSAKTQNGSINDHLLVGPKQQNDIRSVLLNFRIHAVVFVADVVKMFRNIWVSEEDRAYQHILWRFDTSAPLLTYQLNTVTYGLSCAPYLALRVLRQLREDEGSKYPKAAEILERDVYVDDYATGSYSVEDALELQNQLIRLMKLGGFELGKWASNRKELLQAVSAESLCNPVSISAPDDTTIKVLGIQWDSSLDSYSYKINLPVFRHYTKRSTLSVVARIYDPLGFLCPYIILLKIFMQSLWKESLEWDQLLPSHLADEWELSIKQFDQLSNIRVPRFVKTSPLSTYQVIGFCDASIKAYCAVIYLKTGSVNGKSTHLLVAKTKLAPLKTISVPRLELCGALLLSKLYQSISSFLSLLPSSIFQPVFFTDSSIVLGWLNTPPFKLKTFVANRVSEIGDLTPLNCWRHVDTEQNPADCGSRGLSPLNLIQHHIWWQGPKWLLLEEESWPASSFSIQKGLPEVKKTQVSLSLVSKIENPFLVWMKQFSSFMKMIRVLAVLLRCIHNRHNKLNTRTGPLQLPDLDAAMNCCIKAVQHDVLLEGNLKPENINRLFGNLCPFFDRLGLLRVGGRLTYANLPYNSRHPILLPSKSHFTVLLIDYYHSIFLHPGPTLLQALLQTRFWVPSLRRLVRQRTFYCLKCYKKNAKARVPIMADLPNFRVKGNRPFTHVGTDFAGPFIIRDSLRRKPQTSKAYLCLFVCMQTKAVHLETVAALTTEAFLACFDRFLSRRGLPERVYSDCGTNFVGAKNKLKELYQWFNMPKTQAQVNHRSLSQGIQWNFNPPKSPHFGGIWEAGVRSVKTLMVKSAGAAPLTFEELSTLFTRIEAILNSRPLCPLTSNIEDCDYLSPGHFLVGGPLLTYPEPSFLDRKEHLLSRWQLVKRMRQHFWARWRMEYLQTLQKRHKWTKPVPNIQVGDLVILMEETSDVLSWPTARVIEVHPGRDGVVRVATVKTNRSTYQRSVQKLIPLLPLYSPAYDC